MAGRHIFTLILLIISMLFVGCSNDVPSSKVPDQAPAAVPPTEAAPTKEPQTSAVEKPTEDTAQIASPENAIKPPVSKSAKPKLPPSAAPEKKANPAGNPTGYITRKEVILQSEPSPNAQKTSSLKIYEAVIILESKMTDETGKAFDVPQWYKVQLANKQVGWVVSRSVTIN